MLAPAPAWRKRVLAGGLASMVLCCMALGLCAMLGQGGVENVEGRVLGCMSLGLCYHAR